ncbi:hypothetical protein [Natronococcus wangiae]|uniref:hypothetical protein n=1 Tax=Natronococcus wangiae TaxID=3068275 RepID=UPI00273EF859|nr:hypothetical protein [Natronococcus sp. AD5]
MSVLNRLECPSLFARRGIGNRHRPAATAVTGSVTALERVGAQLHARYRRLFERTRDSAA